MLICIEPLAGCIRPKVLCWGGAWEARTPARRIHAISPGIS